MGRYRHRGLIGRLTAADRRRVRDAAELLEVSDLLRRQFGELSSGQRQRVLMAQTIMQEGDLLLLDEPITGLDLASQGRILEVINAERARGAIVVLSTHHLDEARRCDHVVLLANRLVAQGPPAEVLTAEVLQASYQGRIVQAGICCGPEPECCGPPAAHEECCEHPADRLLVLDDHAHGHGEHDEARPYLTGPAEGPESRLILPTTFGRRIWRSTRSRSGAPAIRSRSGAVGAVAEGVDAVLVDAKAVNEGRASSVPLRRPARSRGPSRCPRWSRRHGTRGGDGGGRVVRTARSGNGWIPWSGG